jgi:hypothetical protein
MLEQTSVAGRMCLERLVRELTAKSFDAGYHFMLVEVARDALHFQVISDENKTVDSGSLPRFSDRDKKRLATQ